jgi:hypothetical protein
MITIFTIPKPFVGENIVNQKNAILSWKKSVKNSQIILWGDDMGVEDYAIYLKVEYGGNVPRNNFNTPFINEVFDKTKKIAKYEYLMYINSDIIVTDDLYKIISDVLEPFGKKFIVCGRRIDCNLKRELNFNENWIFDLKSNVLPSGIKHGNSGIDYFLYPKNLPILLKPFAVGRPGWDNWFLYHAKKNKICLIDASDTIKAIHQNHIPAYTYKSKETKENQNLLNGFIEVATIYHSDYILTPNGLKKTIFLRRIISWLSINYPFSYIFAFRRKFLYRK